MSLFTTGAERLLAATILFASACGSGGGDGPVEAGASEYVAERVNLELEVECGANPCSLVQGETGFWLAVSAAEQRLRIPGLKDELQIVEGRAAVSASFELYQFVGGGRIERYTLERLALTLGADGSVEGIEGGGAYEASQDCEGATGCVARERGTFSIRSFHEAPFVPPVLELVGGGEAGPGDTLMVTSSSSPFLLESAEVRGEGRSSIVIPDEARFDWMVSLQLDGALAFDGESKLVLRGRDFADAPFESSLPLQLALP